MQCITKLIGRDITKLVVTEYNKQAIIHLLVKVALFLNLVASRCALQVAHFLIDSFFDAQFLPQKLVKFCSCLSSVFHGVIVFDVVRFSNVSFLA